jgi:hypothetical protein
MADIKIREVELSLRTVKLTKQLLKQMPILRDYPDKAALYEKGGEFKPGVAIGWIHGLLLGDEFARYLLINRGDGDYGLIETSTYEIKRLGFKQIYL